MSDQVLTHEISKYNEEWEVFIAGKSFVLDEKEHAVLEDAVMKGFKGTIQFKDKLLNLTYFQSANLISRVLKPEFQIGAGETAPLTDEQLASNRTRISQLRNALNIRLSMEPK